MIQVFQYLTPKGPGLFFGKKSLKTAFYKELTEKVREVVFSKDPTVGSCPKLREGCVEKKSASSK